MKYIVRDPQGNARGVLNEEAYNKMKKLVRGYYRMAKYTDALLKVWQVEEDNCFGSEKLGVFVYLFKGDTIVPETEEN